MKKSIIIPAYNEEEAIGDIVRRCQKISQKGDEIIVVDDGSTDNTFLHAKKAGAKTIRHTQNKGKAAALRTGIQNAKNPIIVTIDGDATYPPEAIPKIVMELPSADMVVGSRFMANGSGKSIFTWNRKWANQIGAGIASVLTGKKITDVTSGMRSFRKEWINQIPIYARGLDFEAELTVKAITRGNRYKEVSIIVNTRMGKSNLRFFRDLMGFFVALLRGRFIP